MAAPTPVVFIPALLCDEQMYLDVIVDLGDVVDAHVLLSPKPPLEASVTDKAQARASGSRTEVISQFGKLTMPALFSAFLTATAASAP